MPHDSPRMGFTLIELSVVLVIIGLLSASVLVGKDLIHEAELRRQIGQLEEYHVAYNTFRVKYNCLAGDCEFAEELFSDVTNGNGNGLIETNTGVCYDLEPTLINPNTGNPYGPSLWSTSLELQNFFIQLSKSQLIRENLDGSAEIGRGLPALRLNGNATFFAGDSSNFECNNNSRRPLMDDYRRGNNALWLQACSWLTNDEMRVWDDGCGIFTAFDQKRIDTKVDDGLPLSGNFFGFRGSFIPLAECINATETDYDPQAEHEICMAAFVID